jgi:2-keto-4-pentenoate hydratase/2-oxohepta-3-ene-1,7-dioic acid hydratase in catechol pathway
MSLQPGDVIATGTPPGVGQGMNPPVFLKAGDEVETSVAGLGTQKQTVIEP